VTGLLSGGYGLVVRFNLRAGHEDAFDALTEETVAAIRMSEPATVAYLIHLDASSPSVRVFYELYRNVEAFEAHEDMSHVQRFLAERTEHLTDEPEVWRVTLTGGVLPAEVHAEHG
jgi:quinol monooxygenase YgiN